MISAKLLHAVLNALQVIMGWIDLGEVEDDKEKRHVLLNKARDAIRQLSRMLEERVRRKENSK